MFWLFKKKQNDNESLKKLSEREIQSQLYGHLKKEQGLPSQGSAEPPCKGTVPKEVKKIEEVQKVEQAVPKEAEKVEQVKETRDRIKEISSIISHEKTKQILVGVGIAAAGILVIAVMFSVMIKFAPKPNKAVVKKELSESAKLKLKLLKPYTIQAATFSRKSDTDAAIDKLSQKGYSARLIRVDSKKGQTLYRIYVDNFAKKEEAKDMLEKLKSEGFKDSFIRLER